MCSSLVLHVTCFTVCLPPHSTTAEVQLADYAIAVAHVFLCINPACNMLCCRFSFPSEETHRHCFPASYITAVTPISKVIRSSALSITDC